MLNVKYQKIALEAALGRWQPKPIGSGAFNFMQNSADSYEPCVDHDWQQIIFELHFVYKIGIKFQWMQIRCKLKKV